MPDASFLSSDLFLLTLTVGLYCLGGMIYRRTRLPLLHPVLLTFVAVIVFLRCAGIGYERYRDATGILNFALGMSVVALGYLLYEQLERLRGSLLPVGIATLAGCVVGVLSVVYIAMAFGAERQILNSIAPKSVTVPIAVSVAGPLGGNVSVTSVVVFCVGIFGSIFGEWILRRCGVRDPEARGFALGAAAHGIGTARAIEIGAAEGALSGLAMALMGLATALLMPLERGSILPASVAGVNRGQAGSPGQLKGVFDTGALLGDLRANTTGVTGLCWIDSDTHTWKNGQYYCKLTLNFRSLVDDTRAGSEL